MAFDKDATQFQWGKDGLFYKWCWENCISTWKTVNLDPYLTMYTKELINMDQSPKCIKLLEENIGAKIHNLGLDNEFLDMTPKAQASKKKNHTN